MKYGYLGLVLLLAAAAALSACGAGANGPAAEEARLAGLTIDASALTEEPSFIDWEQDGTAMQLIALKTGNEVRLAFNTCQSCQGSPWAWFEYLEDGTLQCQNCLQTFGPEIVGTKDAVGCCPITVSDFSVDGDTVTVPASVLSENAFRFKNWKKTGK